MQGMRSNYGWLVIAAVFLSTGLAIGSSQYAFGVFVDPLEEEFGWSRTQINTSLSFLALSSLIAPVVGRIMDRFGARPVMYGSLVLLSLSYLLRPFITELWHWYAVSVLQYLAFPGAAMLPAGRLVAIWFPRTRGRMMGLATMGANFGGFTMTPLAGLVVGVASWQWGYGVFGFLALGVGMLALLVVREAPRTPLEVEAGTAREEGANGDDASGLALTGVTPREALRSRSFYRVTLAILLAAFTYSAILPQVIPHLTNEGISTGQATLLLSVMAAFGMVGKLLFGYLSERITARNAFIVSLFGQILGVVLIVASGASPLVWLALPVFGLAFGGLGALMPLIVQETFGVRAFGSIFGMVNMATVVSFLSGPILVGLVFDATGSYRPAFITIAAFYFIGALVLIGVRSVVDSPEQHPLQAGRA